MSELERALRELTRPKRQVYDKKKVLRAPFSYPGSKMPLLNTLGKILPYKRCWVEVFGGSMVVTLNRTPSLVEVVNDTHSGIVALYRCLRDPALLERLNDWINLTVNSYEDWLSYKEHWRDASDPVERAGRWLYVITYSFSALGRNWGFSPDLRLSGRLIERTECFKHIHQRLRNVTIENNDWRTLLHRYDQGSTVFYLDPPYLDTQQQALEYGSTMAYAEHEEMLDTIANMVGFVAVSGYANHLYDRQKFWTARHTVDIRGLGNKQNEEVIWIKS